MSSHNRLFFSTKSAIAAVFLVSGAFFGLLTARLPALTEQAGLTLADVGVVLFVFGCTCCVSLLMVGAYLRRFGSFRLLCFMTPLSALAITVLGFSQDKFCMYVAAIVLAHALSTVDVTMNTQAMIYETRTKKMAMSLLHAFYGIGAILACVFAAIFSYFDLGVGINLLAVSSVATVIFLCVAPSLYREDETEAYGGKLEAVAPEKRQESARTIALIGAMVLLMYCAEGIVTDWGSLFMTQVKGASHSLAAMTYGIFNCTVVVLSLFGDPIRKRYGEFPVMAVSAVVATLGMLIVILAPQAYGTLFGYSVVGLGLALMVPILFSLAGRTPGVDAQYASARVSVYAYTGILFFPPFVGFAAEWIGLSGAMCTVFLMIALFAVGLFWLRKRAFLQRGT